MIRRILHLDREERRLLRWALRELWRAKRDLRHGSGTALQAARASAPATQVGLEASRIAWAVKAVARRLPGTKCLPQALAAHRMLHAAGHAATIHVGAAPHQEGAFEAHAWTTLDGRVLVGDMPGLAAYREFAP